MRKTTVVLVVSGALLGTLVLIGPRLLRDPEVSNPREVSAPVEDLHLPPDFTISDPGLLTGKPHEIVERIGTGASDAGLEGIPYFVELADGRYVFGHSDHLGRSRPIYTSEPVRHQTYWYGDAIERWQTRTLTTDSGITADQSAGSDGAALKR